MISFQNNTSPLGKNKGRAYPKHCTPAVLCDKKEKIMKKRKEKKRKEGEKKGDRETQLATMDEATQALTPRS